MATKPLKRAYKGKDVDMLTACSTIIGHTIDNKTFLISKRPTWADPFLPDLKTRIDNAFTDILGIDNAKDMRDATTVVTNLQTDALRDLAEFKIQIEEDFKGDKKRRDTILNILGFKQHHKAAQNKDQEALIELLAKFLKNMTSALETEITNAGMASALITAIKGYANTLKNSNITQETLKGIRKTITQTGQTELNAIYNATISVAKISFKFFKKDKATQDKFSYTKTIKALNRVVIKEEGLPPAP